MASHKIKFYRTGFTPNHRAIDNTALTRILSTAPFQTITLENMYINGNTFFVNRFYGQQLIRQQMDYCVYQGDINDTTDYMKYYFITAIEQNPVGGDEYGYTVYLALDIWTTYVLQDRFESHFNIRGILSRAHVNDWENNKATLKYCLEEPEGEILSDGISFTRQGVNTNNYSSESPIKMLYVLVNAGTESEPAANEQKPILRGFTKNGSWSQQGFLQYRLYFIPINIDTGEFVRLRVYKSSSTYEDYETLGNITDLTVSAGADSGTAGTGIVNMIISDIFPDNGYVELSPTMVVIPYNSTNTNYSFVNDPGGKLFSPKDNIKLIYVNGPIILNRVFQLNKPVSYTMYHSGDEQPSITTYEEYLEKGIVKLNTDKYNPRAIVFDGQTYRLNMFQQTTQYKDSFYASLDPLLQYIIVSESLYTKDGFASSFTMSIHTNFEPVAQNSYWTRLNARQSTIEANRAVSTQQLRTASKAVGGYVNAVSNIVSGAGGILSPKPSKILGGVGQEISGVGGIATTSINLAADMNDLRTVQERSAIAIERNEDIINQGITMQATFNASGLYTTNRTIYIVYGDLTEENRKNIALDLHYYGYATNLIFNNEYFTKHKRSHFNFVIAEEVQVSGLPTAYCRAIEDMFIKGVTLWNDTPQNYEVVNLPV